MRYPGDYLYCIPHSPVPLLTALGVFYGVFCWFEFWRKKAKKPSKPSMDPAGVDADWQDTGEPR